MLSHNPSTSLLPRQESTLSFHIDHFNQNQSSFTLVFKNIPILMAIYSILHLIDLTISYYALHQILPQATILQAIISFTTIRSLLLVILLLIYIKILDQSLFYLDDDCRKLILMFSILQLLGSLSYYYTFALLPFSQASTFSQLVSGITLLLSYIFIKQKNDLFILLITIQIIVTLTFNSTVGNIILAIISPLSSSFMGILQQVTAKQINKFTIILYTCLLNAPVLLILSLLTGSLSYCVDIKFFMLILLTCICQLISFQFMSTLINSQIKETTIWILSGIIIMITIPLQIWFFNIAISLLPLISQVIIIVVSILITNK